MLSLPVSVLESLSSASNVLTVAGVLNASLGDAGHHNLTDSNNNADGAQLTPMDPETPSNDGTTAASGAQAAPKRCMLSKCEHSGLFRQKRRECPLPLVTGH